MSKYHIYANRQRHLVATPTGFSFVAAVSPDYHVFTLSAKGMNPIRLAAMSVAALLFVVLAFLAEQIDFPPLVVGIIVLIGLYVFVGSRANDWQESKLQGQGYELVGKSSGTSQQDALRRWGNTDACKMFFASTE